MIIDPNPKNAPGANAKGREALCAEDLDLINQKAGNITGMLGIATPCHGPLALVGYLHKEKAIQVSCPQCGKVAAIISVKERGTTICTVRPIQEVPNSGT